jgi:hypothetical protein
VCTVTGVVSGCNKHMCAWVVCALPSVSVNPMEPSHGRLLNALVARCTYKSSGIWPRLFLTAYRWLCSGCLLLGEACTIIQNQLGRTVAEVLKINNKLYF